VRIRSIKPEFWRSADISSLEWESRLLFIGLWSYVDDNGVGQDKLSAITADLFADDLERDSSETFARVSRGLQNLSEAGRIIRYTVEDKPFLEIVNWGKHQRIDKPNKARYPHNDAEFAVIRDTLARVSRESSDWNRGTEEQRNRGTGDEKTPSKPPASTQRLPPSLFDQFWEWYPRKVGKEAAKKAWDKARTKTDQQHILQGLENYRLDPNLPAKEFIPHPATWLNEGRWDDEPLPVRGQQTRPTGSQVRLQAGFELLQRVQAREQQEQQLLQIED
jgi:hypothetical protein